jgi:Ca2+-binding RTX toxin-like protein
MTTFNSTPYNDFLLGGLGNDTFNGGSGNDTMSGGGGYDTANYRNLSQAITLLPQGVMSKGSLGTDLISEMDRIVAPVGKTNTIDASSATGGASLTVNLGTNSLRVNGIPGIGSLSFTVENFVKVIGTSNNDSLTGNTRNNTLDGRAGNDTLSGGSGNDTLFGGDGTDYLDGGTGFDLMSGGTGNDTYVVDSISDRITENSGAGVDTVQASISYTLGSTLENLILTGSGNLNGTGNSYGNLIIGNAGKNSLSGGAGNDTLTGGDGNDTLVGGTGSDSLSGGNGIDRLNGYSTSLTGGTEYDTLSGGAGADYFILGGSWGVSYQGSAYAIIADWNAIDDFIEVRGSTNQYSLVTGDFSAGSSASDTAIYYNGTDLIGVVQDSTNVSISRDFVFV